jgi:hypothetical protein
MIKVFLQGGLGNQMFQYAAGFALATQKNTDLVIDAVFLNDRFPRKEFTYRDYALDIFSIRPQFTRLSEISHSISIPGLWLGADLAWMKFEDKIGLQKIKKESEHFDKDVWEHEIGDNLTLRGYFQSEYYFSSVKENIRREFIFKDTLSAEVAEIAKSIRLCNSVSLHIRRGDYIHFLNNIKLFGETDLSYYARAVSYIASRIENPHFFIFSNDIEWCRENVKLQFPMTYIDPSLAGPKDSFHLHLMSLCAHNIIANSSFSWWGAWLNQNVGKIIIAPKKWYADEKKNNEDIIPTDWVKI